MATRNELEADVFDRAAAGLFALEGNIRGALRTLNQVRGRKLARGTDREAALLKTFALEVQRIASLLDDAAKEVDVVVHRKKQTKALVENAPE